MKRIALSITSIVVLSVGMLLIAVTTADSQTTRRLTSTPKAFQSFYTKFRAAVLRGDKKAVASMTSFPFPYGWDAGDEGTYTHKQFLAKYNDMFRGTRKLFSRSNPSFTVDGNSISITNMADASGYIFEKKGHSYYFTSFVVEP